MDVVQLFIRVYVKLVRLYPHRFRAQFGDEMRIVFAQAVAEEVGHGGILRVTALCVRELADLPRALLVQYWHCAKEAAMCRMGASGERPGLVPMRGGLFLDPIWPWMQRHPAIKRAIDLILAALGLLVSAPLLLVISVLVRLDSPGPALFRQRRVGRDGEPYTMYKFRSMVTGAGNVQRSVSGRDPRVTRVGRLIRTLRVDELPQLYNVIRGEMSILGPRPELPQQ